MIEIAKLKNLLKCEAAADDWWKTLSPKEKKVYLAAHPRSKYAKGSTPISLNREAERHMLESQGLFNKALNTVDSAQAKHHHRVSKLHARIAQHLLSAAGHKNGGRDKRANVYLSRAEQLQHRIDKHLASQLGKTIGTTKSAPKSTVKKAVTPGSPDDFPRLSNKPTKFRTAKPPKAVPEEKIAVSPIHTGRSATKASNGIVRQYGGKRLQNWSSNPYSDSQSFSHSLSAENAEKLKKHLRTQGWDESPLLEWHKHKDPTHNGNSFRYRHPDGGHVVVHHDEGTNGPYARATVYGDKKAKRSTLPYYD